MSWRHRIALVLLTVLVSLPAAGATCAMACASASSATAHHADGENCDQLAPVSAATTIVSTSGHDCGTHKQAVAQAATAAASRADVTATSAPIVLADMNVPLEPQRDHGSTIDPNPPSPKPPQKTTRVLRV